MSVIFTIALSVIGSTIGFIMGMTLALTFRVSDVLIVGSGVLLALLGAFYLSKLAPFICEQDRSIRIVLLALCSVIALLCVLLLIVTISTFLYR